MIFYFDCRTTQGVVKEINNKLKLIKKGDYRFRNFDNFSSRCFLTWLFPLDFTSYCAFQLSRLYRLNL
ncbi:MAG: hypothetical protein KME09_10180 [Pleurocapsa minor HA4230-MV1]|nr:hypothetical protein [Pleurocapsa minor HA4230-MV1]